MQSIQTSGSPSSPPFQQSVSPTFPLAASLVSTPMQSVQISASPSSPPFQQSVNPALPIAASLTSTPVNHDGGPKPKRQRRTLDSGRILTSDQVLEEKQKKADEKAEKERIKKEKKIARDTCLLQRLVKDHGAGLAGLIKK